MTGLEASAPTAAPVLSTPETHIFDSYTPAATPSHTTLSDDVLQVRYQIQWTVEEIRSRRWRRIALQFPDQMLPDAPRVFELLRDGLRSSPRNPTLPLAGHDVPEGKVATEVLEHEVTSASGAGGAGPTTVPHVAGSEEEEERLYILGDTSYGACCVDEIAADHVAADAVVHYGRACLSPTARLPVLHVFTVQPLDTDATVTAFEETYPERDSKVLLVADVTFSSHVPTLATTLAGRGYTNVFATEVVRNPSSLIPNRTVPVSQSTASASDGDSALADWHLFHVSNPPSALLLTLTSRVSSIRIYPTESFSSQTAAPSARLATPMPLLRRRYALLTRLRTAAIIGILINTLSASSTLPMLAHLKKLIAEAGKKSYTVVVGKVNAAKLANFAEVDGWVVVGCWESSLLEDDEGKGGSGWWKPCVTPWELEAALLCPEGSGMVGWRTDLESVLERAEKDTGADGLQVGNSSLTDDTIDAADAADADADAAGPLADEEESEPPEFDLRTGKYVSTSRPMRVSKALSSQSQSQPHQSHSIPGNADATALTRRPKSDFDLAVINGQVSPGAAFLREKRTWMGLGSDFEIAYEHDEGGDGDGGGGGGGGEGRGGRIEEGRRGLARGYAEERKE